MNIATKSQKISFQKLFAPNAGSFLPPSIAQSLAGRSRSQTRVVAAVVAGTLAAICPPGKVTSPSAYVHVLEEPNSAARIGAPLEPTSAENLSLVRRVLNPQVLELSQAFGVSRQAVYDWQKGSKPSAKAELGLQLLARIAQMLEGRGISVDHGILNRKVPGGSTLLQAVVSGQFSDTQAQRLVDTLYRESQQRFRLQQQLAARKRAPAQTRDYGAPAMSEEV